MKNDNQKLDDLVRILGVHEPTSEQAQVIRHPLTVNEGGREVPAPLLVVAGAGSGKTETMSLRAVYLAAAKGVADETILGLTFTRKAAAELRSRLTERLAQLAAASGERGTQGFLEFQSAPVATTYNSFALDVVKEFGPLIGLDADITHLDGAASWQLMLNVVEQWQTEITGDHSKETVVRTALNLRDAIANQGMSVNEARRALQRLTDRFEANKAERGGNSGSFLNHGATANQARLELLEIITEFEQQKSATNRLDFSDQVLLATRIVREAPMAREELRRRHQVVFLDEFQDTSVAQMEFLSALFSDHPVTAVGDPNQAIYGWRGASAASLDDFHRLFTRQRLAPKTTLNLSTAWRNSLEILKVANAVAEPLRRPPAWASVQARKTWTPSPILKPRKGAPKGTVRSVFRQSPAEQVEEVVDFVRKLRHENEENSDGFTTIAVLSRKRSMIAPIMNALLEAGFPAETNSPAGLLTQPAILDLRAALEVAGNISESAQLMRLLGNLDLGSKDLWRLGRWAKKISRTATSQSHPTVLLLEAVDRTLHVSKDAGTNESGMSSEAYRRVHQLAGQLRTIRGAVGFTIVEQVEVARRALRLDEEAAAVGEGHYVAEMLDSILQIANEYQEQTVAPTMTGFLTWMSAAEERERGLPLPTFHLDPHAVQVMTIHGAKGLEWDAVAVVGLENGTFPSHRGGGKKPVNQGNGILRPPEPAVPTPQNGWWKAPGAFPYPARHDKEHLPDPPIWDPEMKKGQLEATFKEDIGAYLLAEERRLAYVALTRPRRHLLLVGSWLAGEGRTPRYPSVFMLEAQRLAGVNIYEDDCPTDEEVESIIGGDSSAQFPRQPSFRRKQITLSAALVKQEHANLEGATAELARTTDGVEPSGEPKAEAAERLRSVNDPWLAQRARFLINEHEESLELKGTDPRLRAELEARATHRNIPWEFSATTIFGAAEAENLWVDLRRPLPKEPSASSAVGTAFHQWVETELRKVPANAADVSANVRLIDVPAELLADTSVGAVQAADLAFEASLPVLLQSEEQIRLEKLQGHFRQIPWISTMEVHGLEIPFAFEMEGILVRGRIDAVFRDPENGEYWLVDWKTGTVPHSSRANEQTGRYLSQLAIYQEAWRRRIGDPSIPISAKLVFIKDSGVVEIGMEELQSVHLATFDAEWTLERTVQNLQTRLTESDRKADATARPS